MNPPALFEELDYRQTALGELILQRRLAPWLDGGEVYEVKLNGEYLMSSLWHAGEEALARLGLAAAVQGARDVVVGGLGLGYTAAAALASDCLRRLVVVEALEPVIRWHREARVPNGRALCADPRCELLHADFFALARGPGFDPGEPGRQWDAVLLDIDHTPSHLLNERHADFYAVEGLCRLKALLHPGGVFALWSDAEPDGAFLERLRGVFGAAEGRVVAFDNPLTGGTATNGVYIACRTATPAETGADR